MTDTANRVKKIVAEHLGVEESKVTDTAAEKILTVKDAIDYLNKNA